MADKYKVPQEGMLNYLPEGYGMKPYAPKAVPLDPNQAPSMYAGMAPTYEEYALSRATSDNAIDLAQRTEGRDPVSTGRKFRGQEVYRYPNGTLAVAGEGRPHLLSAAEIGEFMAQAARSGNPGRLSDNQSPGLDMLETVGAWDERMQQKIGKRYPKLAETYQTLVDPEGTPLDKASKYMHGVADQNDNVALSTFADLGGYGLDLAKNLPGFVLPNPSSPLQVGGELLLGGSALPAGVALAKGARKAAPVLAKGAKTLAKETMKGAQDTYKGVQALPGIWGAIKNKRALEARLAVTQDPVLREQIIQELGDADLLIREQELRMPEQELGAFAPSSRKRFDTDMLSMLRRYLKGQASESDIATLARVQKAGYVLDPVDTGNILDVASLDPRKVQGNSLLKDIDANFGSFGSSNMLKDTKLSPEGYELITSTRDNPEDLVASHFQTNLKGSEPGSHFTGTDAEFIRSEKDATLRNLPVSKNHWGPAVYYYPEGSLPASNLRKSGGLEYNKEVNTSNYLAPQLTLAEQSPSIRDAISKGDVLDMSALENEPLFMAIQQMAARMPEKEVLKNLRLMGIEGTQQIDRGLLGDMYSKRHEFGDFTYQDAPWKIKK